MTIDHTKVLQRHRQTDGQTTYNAMAIAMEIAP